MRYETKCRKVGGLETSYNEWVVSLCTDAGSELERVASFMHSGCAEGLRAQLQRAYEHGIAEANLAAVVEPSDSPTPDDDWNEAMKEAHDSLNRLEDVGMSRLAESLEGLKALDKRAPYVDIENEGGGKTRVHLLADEPPQATPDSKRRDTRPGLGKRTYLPPKMDKIDD